MVERILLIDAHGNHNNNQIVWSESISELLARVSFRYRYSGLVVSLHRCQRIQASRASWSSDDGIGKTIRRHSGCLPACLSG